MTWDHSGCLNSWMASSQSLTVSPSHSKESQNSVAVPHTALLTGCASNAGSACSHLAGRHMKAGGCVPLRCSLLNPAGWVGAVKLALGPSVMDIFVL